MKMILVIALLSNVSCDSNHCPDLQNQRLFIHHSPAKDTVLWGQSYKTNLCQPSPKAKISGFPTLPRFCPDT